MEIIVLIAVITAYSRAAKLATRSRFSWAAIGGVVYIGSLVLFQVALSQVPTPSSSYLLNPLNLSDLSTRIDCSRDRINLLTY